MKTFNKKYTIKVWNPTTGNQLMTLEDFRKMLLVRRMNALNPPLRKDQQKKVYPYTRDRNHRQVAAHYTSYELRTLCAEKAIEIFNAGGAQIANIIK